MERVLRRVSVPPHELLEAVRGALLGHGASSSEAYRVAHALVEADLRGQHSHGVFRLPMICRRIDAGLLLPGAEPVVTRPSSGILVVDGRQGFGHVVAWQAMELAVEAAAMAGVSAASVRNNNHIGMAGYYAEEAARRGSVLIVMTVSEAMVRPHGGATPLLGTNPIAIGFPADPEPFVLDMSTSATAIGKLMDRRERGQAIPPDWAVDADGAATTDAAEALAGAINPFGGAKGYGLGLSVALLAAVLGGAATGPEVAGTLDAEHRSNKGDLLLAIDPSFFPGHEHLRERSTAYLDLIRSSPPAAGSEHVLIPGDRGRAARTAAMQEGVSLPQGVWEAVLALAEARAAVGGEGP